MKNYSGSFKNPFIKSTTTSTQPPSTTFRPMEYGMGNQGSNSEIKEMMQLMEELRQKDPENFGVVITNTKLVLDMVSSNSLQSKNDIDKMDALIQEIEAIDKKFIYYIALKGSEINEKIRYGKTKAVW